MPVPGCHKPPPIRVVSGRSLLVAQHQTASASALRAPPAQALPCEQWLLGRQPQGLIWRAASIFLGGWILTSRCGVILKQLQAAAQAGANLHVIGACYMAEVQSQQRFDPWKHLNQGRY